MLYKNCDYNLTSITISVIVSFIFTLLFYIGTISNILTIFIFSLILALLSLLIIGLFGISDNGLTRERLCRNCLSLIFSILGNILFSLISLSTSLTSGNIISAIIISISAFFFIFNLINLISMLLDIIKYN